MLENSRSARKRLINPSTKLDFRMIKMSSASEGLSVENSAESLLLLVYEKPKRKVRTGVNTKPKIN